MKQRHLTQSHIAVKHAIVKPTLLAVCLASVFPMQVQAGSEIETLINVLHENGMVNEDQYQRLLTELQQNQKTATEEKKAIDAKLAEATKPSEVEVSVKGGLSVKTRDGNFTTKIGGRVQADAATYSGEPEMGNGTEIRRARMNIQGTMYKDWGYKLEYDFANTDSNGSKGIADAVLTYNGFDNLEIKAGHFKDPFSLEEQTSSNNTVFIERALPSAFAAGRHIGVMTSTFHKNWTLAGGLFGDTITAKGSAQDEGWGAGSRLTYTPINQPEKIVHLGLALNYRNTGDLTTASFKQTPESHIAGINIVNTGTISDVKDYLKTGVEIATVLGPFAAQAEYITTSVNRDSGSDVDFDGWYAQASYFLTGESRNYKNGAFGTIKPKKVVGEGGIGAWEAAIRYSNLDLSDADIDGGEATAMALGINWYPTPTLRFSTNYIDVLDVDGGSNDGQQAKVFQLRSQWAF